MIDSSSHTYRDEGDGTSEVLDLFGLSANEVTAAWSDFADTHIMPSRLFQIAVGMEDVADSDCNHLEWCETCRAAFEAYRPIESSPSALVSRTSISQRRFWTNDNGGSTTDRVHASPNGHSRPAVPALIRAHFHVDAPILFPGNEVAFESWQFGRLLQISKEEPELADRLLGLIVDNVTAHLAERIDHKHLMLVCFGRAMHRCGIRIAARFQESGFAQPHIVLAHDFYSLTVVCDPKEFRKADVIVLVDVVHSGATLDKLMALCLSNRPQRVRGLALIDQSESRSLCSDWTSVWQEPREVRASLDDFLRDSSELTRNALRRFEPNDEVAVSRDGLRVHSRLNADVRVRIDSQLMAHIHATDALKCDHRIGQKRYPYVVNVLDLIKKSSASREFIIERSAKRLEDLREHRVILAFHAGRSARAGVLARMLGSQFGWPSLPVGSRGSNFAVTDKQLRRLACYDIVVLVDAAIRTGDTVSAIARAIDDKWLRKHTRVVAFSVLDALSSTSQDDLAAELGIEIRTLFEMPLAPPTEQVRHWMNAQKSMIRERMNDSGEFNCVEHVLKSYCDPIHPHYSSHETDREISETRALMQSAMESALQKADGAARIEKACREGKSHLIRHLSVNEVVHDHNVQGLLIGVMYNSVKASLKESAVFALASARNYEWMSLDWLRCNRPFLTSESNAWKSIVMVECEMKMSRRQQELSQFREAAIEFRDKEASSMPHQSRPEEQLVLPVRDMDSRPESTSGERTRLARANAMLVERLDAMIVAAE